MSMGYFLRERFSPAAKRLSRRIALEKMHYDTDREDNNKVN